MMLFAPCGWSTSVSHKKFSIVRLSLYYSRFCFASDIRKETAKEPSRGTPSPSPKPDNTAGHLALPRGEIMSRVKDYCLLSSSIFLASALLAKCRFVSRTTTPDKAITAIKFGMAMRPLRVSAMSQARPRSIVAPTTMMMMKMIW